MKISIRFTKWSDGDMLRFFIFILFNVISLAQGFGFALLLREYYLREKEWAEKNPVPSDPESQDSETEPKSYLNAMLAQEKVEEIPPENDAPPLPEDSVQPEPVPDAAAPEFESAEDPDAKPEAFEQQLESEPFVPEMEFSAVEDDFPSSTPETADIETERENRGFEVDDVVSEMMHSETEHQVDEDDILFDTNRDEEHDFGAIDDSFESSEDEILARAFEQLDKTSPEDRDHLSEEVMQSIDPENSELHGDIVPLAVELLGSDFDFDSLLSTKTAGDEGEENRVDDAIAAEEPVEDKEFAAETLAMEKGESEGIQSESVHESSLSINSDRLGIPEAEFESPATQDVREELKPTLHTDSNVNEFRDPGQDRADSPGNGDDCHIVSPSIVANDSLSCHEIVSSFAPEWIVDSWVEPFPSETVRNLCFKEESRPMFVRKRLRSKPDAAS